VSTHIKTFSDLAKRAVENLLYAFYTVSQHCLKSQERRGPSRCSKHKKSWRIDWFQVDCCIHYKNKLWVEELLRTGEREREREGRCLASQQVLSHSSINYMCPSKRNMIHVRLFFLLLFCLCNMSQSVKDSILQYALLPAMLYIFSLNWTATTLFALVTRL